jgi:hypothetical protein
LPVLDATLIHGTCWLEKKVKSTTISTIHDWNIPSTSGELHFWTEWQAPLLFLLLGLDLCIYGTDSATPSWLQATNMTNKRRSSLIVFPCLSTALLGLFICPNSCVVSLHMLDRKQGLGSPPLKKNRACNEIHFRVLVKESRLHKNKMLAKNNLHFTKSRKITSSLCFHFLSGLSLLNETTNAKITRVMI